MKKKVLLLLVFACILSSLIAIDGNRKGVLLGFGAGVSQTYFKAETEYLGNTEVSGDLIKAGYATEFKIGYGLTNQFELYYSNQATWFSINNDDGNKVTIADGISVIAASYFISPKLNDGTWHPSAFISAGYGLSSWSRPAESDYVMKGKGVFVGVGYEFIKHYRFSLNYFANDPSTTEDDYTLTYKSRAVMLTISGMYF